MKRLLTYIVLGGACLLVFGTVRAQFVPSPLSLSASPESPSPGQEVVITASTPTTNKNSVDFNWTVDGRARPDLSGVGKNEISLRAGPVGSTLRIAVSVSGPSIENSVSLLVRVSDLSLTWFADTTVPEWYKGKALPSSNSIVTVVAIPRIVLGGSTVRPENLIYTWGLDDEDEILSGVGEQTFKIRVSQIRGESNHVRVTVETQNKEIRKVGELFVVPTDPKVTIYLSSPLGGTEFRSGAPFISVTSRGLLDFAAEVFYFPLEVGRRLSYTWTIAGFSASSAPGKPNLISLNTGDQPIGAVSLGVTVELPNSLLPSVSRFITLLMQ